MSRCAALLEDLEYLPTSELERRLTSLKIIFGELAEYRSICILHQDLSLILDKYHCIYLERSFTSRELQKIPKYFLYRYQTYNTPFSHPVIRGTDFEELSSFSESSVEGKATTN